MHSERDHLLIEPDELLRGSRPGQYYQVYTPWAKRWFERLTEPDIAGRITAQKKGLAYLWKRAKGQLDPRLFQLTWQDLFAAAPPWEDQLLSYAERNRSRVRVPLPIAGSLAALERVSEFRQQGLAQYHQRRDLPGVAGTSRLSIFLKNGSLTSAQVLAALELGDTPFDFPGSATTFVKEIAWREFYYHVLYHCPRVETTAFLEKYRDLPWENRSDWFECWQRGETGYPIVDAGMRELAATGWMHNRVRMIVASFLTKDLLIDWRWGERYFMERLLDGDLAPNNGGWQWSASTGCDAQPYFRIFNPTRQGETFDPDGEYVRRWIPELAQVPAKHVHTPHASGLSLGYPQPIVDHAVQKAKALALYRGQDASRSREETGDARSE